MARSSYFTPRDTHTSDETDTLYTILDTLSYFKYNIDGESTVDDDIEGDPR
jgi:hypothetical protein